MCHSSCHASACVNVAGGPKDKCIVMNPTLALPIPSEALEGKTRYVENARFVKIKTGAAIMKGVQFKFDTLSADARRSSTRS